MLQSTIHYEWDRRNSSKLKNDLRYSNSDAFETFPLPRNNSSELLTQFVLLGEKYHEHRRQLMIRMKLGLTKTYNAFHAKEINDNGLTTNWLNDLDKKTIGKQFGKEGWNLWNHLQKTPGTCSIEEAVEGIVKLRRLHVEMDNAVLAVYGWQDVQLKHDFYEVDYLTENDRVR